MVAKRSSKRRRSSVKAENGTTAKHETISAKPETASSLVKEKAKVVRPKSNEPLISAQKALKTAQSKIEHERQARLKAEKALIESQENLITARLELEQERQARVKRVSFVVRLILDEHDLPGRTEIVHIPSGNNQKFLNLDGESLVAFMKASLSPTKQADIPKVPLLEKIKAPVTEPPELKSSLILSAVEVVDLQYPDILTLVLPAEEPFIVQARFQLHGLGSHPLTTHGTRFDLKVYASEITSGKSKPLTTYNAELVHDMLEYQVKAGVSGLPSGFYRLFILVSLGEPIQVAGYHDGPVIEVL